MKLPPRLNFKAVIKAYNEQGDRYSNAQEILDELKKRIEIEFGYRGKLYSLSFNQRGLHAIEWDKPETKKTYQTPEECLSDYEIEGQKLIEIVTEIDVYAH